MQNEEYKLAGLTDAEIRAFKTPFLHLSQADRSNAFSASDKLAKYHREQPHLKVATGFTIHDPNVCFKKDKVISPADGKAYGNRGEWNDMLKRNNCVEFGNDIKVQPQKKEFKDMNLKPAIAEAMKKAGAIKV